MKMKGFTITALFLLITSIQIKKGQGIITKCKYWSDWPSCKEVVVSRYCVHDADFNEVKSSEQCGEWSNWSLCVDGIQCRHFTKCPKIHDIRKCETENKNYKEKKEAEKQKVEEKEKTELEIWNAEDGNIEIKGAAAEENPFENTFPQKELNSNSFKEIDNLPFNGSKSENEEGKTISNNLRSEIRSDNLYTPYNIDGIQTDGDLSFFYSDLQNNVRPHEEEESLMDDTLFQPINSNESYIKDKYVNKPHEDEDVLEKKTMNSLISEHLALEKEKNKTSSIPITIERETKNAPEILADYEFIDEKAQQQQQQQEQQHHQQEENDEPYNSYFNDNTNDDENVKLFENSSSNVRQRGKDSNESNFTESSPFEKSQSEVIAPKTALTGSTAEKEKSQKKEEKGEKKSSDNKGFYGSFTKVNVASGVFVSVALVGGISAYVYSRKKGASADLEKEIKSESYEVVFNEDDRVDNSKNLYEEEFWGYE